MILACASDVHRLVAGTTLLDPLAELVPVAAEPRLVVAGEKLVAVAGGVVHEVVGVADDILADEVEAVLDMVVGDKGCLAAVGVVREGVEEGLGRVKCELRMTVREEGKGILRCSGERGGRG